MTDTDLRYLVGMVRWVSIPAGLVQRGTPTNLIDAVRRTHADLGRPAPAVVLD